MKRVAQYRINSFTRKSAPAFCTRFFLFALAWLIVSLAMFVATVPMVAGSSVSRVMLYDVVNGTSVSETISVTLVNNTLPSLMLSLPKTASGVVLDGVVQQASENVTVPLTCSECHFTLSYTLADAVQQTGQQFVFSRAVAFPKTPTTFRYEVVLPAGSILGNDPADPAIVPRHTAVSTDGKHMSVVWETKQPELPAQYVIRYSAGVESDLSVSEELLEWPVWVLMGLMLALGLATGMGLQRHLHERFTSQDLPFVPRSLLSPDERTIVELLQREKKSVSQKEMGRLLSWSKSKVSAIMTNLEHKGIVHREKIGRNYSVTLVKAMSD